MTRITLAYDVGYLPGDTLRVNGAPYTVVASCGEVIDVIPGTLWAWPIRLWHHVKCLSGFAKR